MPERVDFSISDKLGVTIDAIDARIKFDATISIGASQVSVIVETDSLPDIFTLKNYVEYLVRMVVDSYCYIAILGYDVEITSATNADGSFIVFGVDVEGLETTKNERPLKYDAVLQLALKSDHLRRALSDFRESIRTPLDTSFFCYRTIESVRQHFVKQEDGDNKAPSWERLRNALRVDRSYIDEVKRIADKQRHGETPYMSRKDRINAIQHASKIIDRFCKYLKRGSTNLSASKFDLLK